jgi:hypothetical protein
LFVYTPKLRGIPGNGKNARGAENPPPWENIIANFQKKYL